MPSGKYERTEEIRQKISLACIGKYPTEETKQKLSIAKLGKKHPQYGKHRTEEVKEKLRLANLGKHLTQETKEKISLSQLGKKYTDESRDKMRLSQLGKHHTKQTIERMRTAHLKENLSDETLRKMSESQKGKYVGENNPNWKGGISFEPYAPEFNKQLKELIRQRDGYKCQLCGMPECENIRKLDIHHIDYIKKNCLPDNLIALCNSCNAKVNFNRDYWTEYFK